MSHRNHVMPLEGLSEDPENGAVNQTSKLSARTIPLTSKEILTDREKLEKSVKFDKFYKGIASKCKPEKKRIDYVLVHRKVDLEKITDPKDREEEERRIRLRGKFEEALKCEGLQKQTVTKEFSDKVYTKLHCPFKRLCEEAEAVSLELPLIDCESENKDEDNVFNSWVKRNFITDNEVDLVSAPFKMERMHIYQDHDDPTHFFRPSLRSLLVEHILINIDLRKTCTSKTFRHAGGSGHHIGNCWGCLKSKNEDGMGDMQKVGLDYMLVEEVYTNRFVLHEESAYDPEDKVKTKQVLESAHTREELRDDPRLDLQLTWTRFFKFQPLWKIRNYFGETIAFYFAWSGTLISTLWLPMLFGIAIFIYGLVKSVQKTSEGRTTEEESGNSTLTDLFQSVKESFDNDITPYFALFISVWGTLFLEIWKRKQSELAYQWDVEQFEENEPDRPEFYGTKQTRDPVTSEQIWYYPFARKAWKLFFSSMTLLFMVCIVISSVLAVIVYRVIATVDYCPSLSARDCLVVSTLVSSLLNAISILILGRVYDVVARKLTDWENHRTQTSYDDSLIIKLFAFQFANNYASCFYIAFFRGRFDDYGLFGRGAKYTDDCEGTCMSQLSFQVLILMLTKPIPKFLTDVILPWGKKLFKSHCQCCACIPFLRKYLQLDARPKSEKTLMEIESEKPSLGNFTLPEYTEKIIQYGLMMLFAASFPLAPLLALLTNMVDIRIDARRMLWWYQRPMANVSEDIGTWYVILTFMNYVGVISNAFLIAFTSSWGDDYDITGKLWIVIGFEHIVFTLKFLLAYLIPDVPTSVSLAIRKKHYQLNKKLSDDKMKEVDNINPVTHAEPESSNRGPVYLAREDPEGGFWRRGQANQDTFEADTEVRRMRRKKKKRKESHQRDENEPVQPRRRDVSPPDYSGRYTRVTVRGPQGEPLAELPSGLYYN